MKLENYSKAAEALNYTPSMMSKTIRKMEEKLGLVLFIRRGAHIMPTRVAHELQREWRMGLRAIGAGVEPWFLVPLDCPDKFHESQTLLSNNWGLSLLVGLPVPDAPFLQLGTVPTCRFTGPGCSFPTIGDCPYLYE